jgi:hypothetical protein
MKKESDSENSSEEEKEGAKPTSAAATVDAALIGQRPPLIPIDARARSNMRRSSRSRSKPRSKAKASDSDDDGYEARTFMRAPLVVGSKMKLPPLVPIDGCNNGSDDSDEDDKNPTPIKAQVGGGGAIPPRPPLKRLTEAQLKIRARLVPIEDNADDESGGGGSSMVNEEMAESFNLPVCSDVFDD